jgi:ABC-type Mn2+/Zn2+ transport system permease subunit
MFYVAPAVALVSGMIGFFLANGFDDPPGQTVAAVQCAMLVVAWVVRWVRR